MNKLVFALALCLLPVAAARTQERQRQQPAAQNEPAKPAPQPARPKPLEVIPDEVFDRELKDLDGRDFYLSNYRGRVFVINIWATWCRPCHAQVPDLNKIYEDYAPRGVEVVGLTTEDMKADAAKVKAFAAEFGVKYRLGWGDAETTRRMMSERPSIPQVFVVSADGRVAASFIGHSDLVSEMIRKSIDKALNPPAAAPPRP